MSIVRIGNFDLSVHQDHIYLQNGLPPTYDYVPWNLVGEILRETRWEQSALIDIGANVGDSLAHFRRFSSAKALCIEPDDKYFPYLVENAKTLKNAELRKALAAPDHMMGMTEFGSDIRTGWSRPAKTQSDAWSGSYISAQQMLKWADGPVVLKTDTDGFDAQIVKAFVPHLRRYFVPLIFFEGPLQSQHIELAYDDYISACDALMGIGYKLLLLTNIGMPYAYVGTNCESFRSCLHSLSMCFSQGRAPCHYFDVIAIHEALTSPTHEISKPWEGHIFNAR